MLFKVTLRERPDNSCSRDAFVGFWTHDVIVPRVRVQRRVPRSEEKSLVEIGFETNDLDVFKVHVVAEMVDVAWFW